MSVTLTVSFDLDLQIYCGSHRNCLAEATRSLSAQITSYIRGIPLTRIKRRCAAIRKGAFGAP